MSNPARDLANMRPRAKFTCVVCGESFEARTSRNTPKFCSNRCRQRDKYQRSKQA